MIKEIISSVKKINRLYALSEQRNLLKPYGLKASSGFSVEISKKAYDRLKILKGLHFSLQHNFDGSKNGNKGYYLVIEGMPSKQYDFTYCVTGKLRSSSNVMDNRYYASIDIDHIDISQSVRQLEQMMEMIGIYLDRKYGNDCGFSLKWNFYEEMFFSETKYNKLLK